MNEELPYSKGRVKYYVSTILETPNITETMYDVTVYDDMESAVDDYLHIDAVDEISMGYVINNEKFELASFDVISMKHEYDNVNWRQFPKLTQNEIAELKDNLSYLEYALQKENTYHSLAEGFNDIVINSVLPEMISNDDVWGAWRGRVANTRRSQDYIDVEIMGIRTQNKVICEVCVVQANKIQDAKEVSFTVNPDKFERSLKEGMELLVKDFSAFFEGSIDLLDTDMEYPVQVYTENGIHTLQEHYEELKQKGYDFEPNREEYFLKDKEKKSIIQPHQATQTQRKPKL